jgi:peptidoglycan/LPS O-acetylase OafA/YrhL
MTGAPPVRIIPALDGLRGIAIVLVMLHHFTLYEPPDEGIEGLVGSVLAFFWMGVDLFFVLSGFLITGILIDARGGKHYFTSFYARRTLRIFPLYYLVLFLALVVLPQFPELEPVLDGQAHIAPEERVQVPDWPYWLYLTNISIAQRDWVHGWVDVAWSLAIEEQFYLVWPLVIWLLPPRLAALLCVVILVAEPAARFYARSIDYPALWLYVLTWYRLDGLAMGALLAFAHRRGLFPAIDRWVPLIVIAAVAGIVWCTIMGGHTWWWNRRMQQFGYSLIAILGGALLVSAINRPAHSLWPRLLSAGWLRAFGKYSYALYLFHLPVMRGVREYVFDPLEHLAIGPWTAQILFYWLAAVPAFALAWLSWRFFEGPILRLKSRFPYRSADSQPRVADAV